MSAYFDLTRVTQLEEIMGTEARSIVASMLSSLTKAIERVESAMADGRLEPVVEAAHSARNDALMLGAGALQEALRDLEAAARDADVPEARKALERLREVWPPTRDELAALSPPP